ncbi:acetyltransferase [Novosphingobium sp. Fuku2-ISO-50]|nr:GNAT family N-acetyltransferase [Novosphingobium sp. Fuku2-ISO-50]KUR77427.1 acetyltransferase [Novosphingobium sp. Fuku2-ISO-50]
MSDMAITHHATAQGGEFVATVPGEAATGQLTYSMRGSVMVADHTLVPAAIGGRGVAGRLVDALIAHARDKGLTIEPQCSYVAAAFKRHPEWADLLA